MHENVAKNAYCPTFTRGISKNQRRLKGGRVDKIQISLKFSRQQC